MGSGYKTFTAGAVLTASDVQNYLQDQSVMVFGGTAARSSAIGTANFEEGMLTYLTDVDKLQVYTGATFADVYPPATSNQGLTLINTTAFSGVASQSFNDVFSTTYDNYRILMRLTASTSISARLRMRVSGADDSTSNYNRQKLEVSVSSVSASAATSTDHIVFGDVDTAKPTVVSMDMFSPFIAQATQFSNVNTNRTDTTTFLMVFAGAHNVATSYTGFSVIASTGTISGTISVYGLAK
jgi:hypothetical protein